MNFQDAIREAYDDSTKALKTNIVGGIQYLYGFEIPAYDYISQTIGSTSKTFVFKTGGSGGTTVATITVNYTDTTLSVMSNVTKT